MAQPKKKTSKVRTDTRRSQISLSTPATIYCEKCHQLKQKHQVCQNCGTYKGKQVINHE